MKHVHSGHDRKAKMDPKDHRRDRRKGATAYGPGETAETVGWSRDGVYNISVPEEELTLLKHRSPQDKAEEKRRLRTGAELESYERREKCRDPATVTRSRRPSETVDREKGKSKKKPHSQKATAAQQRKHLCPPEGYYDRAGSLDYDLDSNDTEDCNTPEFVRAQEAYRVNVSRRGIPTDSSEGDRKRDHGRSSELLPRGQERALKKTAPQQGRILLPCEDEDEDEDHDEAECQNKPDITRRRAPSPRQEAHMNNMRQTPAEAIDNLTKDRLQNRSKEASSLNYHVPQAHMCLPTMYSQGYGTPYMPQQGNPYASYYTQPSVPMGQAYFAQSYGHPNQGVYQQGGTGQAHHPQQYVYSNQVVYPKGGICVVHGENCRPPPGAYCWTPRRSS